MNGDSINALITAHNCARQALAAHKEYTESKQQHLDKEAFVKGYAACFILIEDKFRSRHGVGIKGAHNLMDTQAVDMADLLRALKDAIERPLGVVPDSALPFKPIFDRLP